MKERLSSVGTAGSTTKGHAKVQRLSCTTCDAREHSEWCSLPHEEVATLDRSKTCNLYKPGQVIFYQGNQCLGLYCIESGTVAIRRTDTAGNSMLVRLATRGHTLGYRTFFAGGEYSASAEALSECRICFVDRSTVERLMEDQPTLAVNFMHRMALELGESEEARLQTYTMPVRARFAQLLLSLKGRYGMVHDDGTLDIELPLARQDMASMLGTRPETIARVIRELEQDDVAHFDGRHARIPDLDALLDEVEADREDL